jgi:uncharacterized small protein (DUF1192 family)
MCVVSMVYDHYRPLIPTWPVPVIEPVPVQPSETAPLPIFYPLGPPQPEPPKITVDPVWLAQLLKDFREAVDAAKKVDALTGQPDCEDPEKAKLEARVSALEAELKRLKGKKKRKASSRSKP